MAFCFDPDDEKNLNEIFDELRGRLLQLDRGNVQADKQLEEISRLVTEKSVVCGELKNLKTANRNLQAELTAVTQTANDSQRRILEFQEENGRLKSDNDLFRTENEKMAAAQKKMAAEFTELRRKYDHVLEKVSNWHRIHEEVSRKQAQNRAAMLETAKQIGHTKAHTLYIHQLKQQVEVVYKNAFENIKNLQESRVTPRSEQPQVEACVNKEVRFDETIGTGGMNDPGSSDLYNFENYWKDVNEKMRTELQAYKEELWTGLRALSQLSDIEGTRPYSNSN